MSDDNDRAEQRGIQSIEVGGQLLRALVHVGRPMALKDLARESDMAPAKAHPYMVSFGRLDLIEQDPDSGHYRLGPLALQLGLIALQQADPVQLATPVITELAQRTGHTMAIAVWGDRGATIVRIAESPAPVYVAMRHGTVFSLTHSASGRLFGAYLDAATVRTMLDDERRRDKALSGWKAFEAKLAEVRAHGISRSEGEIVPGVNAMSAPVFDHTGAIVLALTAIGPAALFPTAWDGPIARALKEGADAVSLRLGAAAA
jgi:DNA-binding IclR family transcriptional regulator